MSNRTDPVSLGTRKIRIKLYTTAHHVDQIVTTSNINKMEQKNWTKKGKITIQKDENQSEKNQKYKRKKKTEIWKWTGFFVCGRSQMWRHFVFAIFILYTFLFKKYLFNYETNVKNKQRWNPNLSFGPECLFSAVELERKNWGEKRDPRWPRLFHCTHPNYFWCLCI